MGRLLLALSLCAFVHAQNNVLIVLLDDVGVDMVGCYAEGVHPAHTPVIDGLASQGVLFRNAWSNPCCSPTRATILTGRYGFRTGIGFVISDGGYDLQFDELLLPEVFASTPHSTAVFGKWHLSNSVDGDRHIHPNLSGFEQWMGYYHNFRKPLTYDWWIHTTNGLLNYTGDYATTREVDDFLGWQAVQSGPWFAYLAFHAAHEPFHAPPDHLHTESLPDVDPRVQPKPFYRAAIEAADTELGRLLAGLGPDLAKTNVIVLGDNGTIGTVSTPPFEPSHAKLTPYEGGINVPLIISGPAVSNGGREVDALVNTTDLFTTAIELAGYDPRQLLPPGHVHDSVSLLPYLKDPTQEPIRTWVFAEMWKPNGPGSHNLDLRMLRDERYKIIRRGTDPSQYAYEFYDLVADPFEKVDILQQPGGPNPMEQVRFDALKYALAKLLASG